MSEVTINDVTTKPVPHYRPDAKYVGFVIVEGEIPEIVAGIRKLINGKPRSKTMFLLRDMAIAMERSLG